MVDEKILSKSINESINQRIKITYPKGYVTKS
jgi:hypothetical protein